MKIYDNTGEEILDIDVNDNSYRYRTIMGEHTLTLYYSLAEHLELPVGSYCDYQGERYTLEKSENLQKQHDRLFDYTVVFDAPEYKAKIWKFRNTVDGRLKFSMTAKPHEHLKMFVDNMNRRDSGWTMGDYIDGVEITISYDHDYCMDALKKMASQCKTEYEFTGKKVSLRKVEHNKTNALPMSYGQGHGFKPNVGRANYSDQPPTEILFVQGGTTNIDPSSYGSRELLLPKSQTIRYDGEHFEGDDGFVSAIARTYVTDADGLSIRRADKPLSSLAEDSLDCTDIYPKRVGKVTSLVVVDKDKNFYDIVDNTIPADLNYNDCIIEGENMTIIFQYGMLAGSGKEFDVKYFHDSEKGKAARRFEIVPQEIDGQIMPNDTFKPAVGVDTYAVFHCALPKAYICDDKTKTGASWDMFRQGVRYLFDNEDKKMTFKGEVDGIWSKKDWLNIGGRIILGGYISFSDPDFQVENVLVRITGIKDYVNNPHSPVVELSNSTISTDVATTLKQLESQEVVVEENHSSAISFTKRRFRDAKETISMLEAALLDNFTNSINPIAVQTMSMLVGDESLQFRFVNSKTNPVQIAHQITWDNSAKTIHADAGILQHMTLGINTLSSSHEPKDYHFWDMEEYTSARLDNADAKYYMYAKVSDTSSKGVFILSQNAIKMNQVSGFHHLLVGILNSEYDGERSFVTLYGFTEILPGRVTTDRVVSGDGNSFFDLVANALKLGDKLKFNIDGNKELKVKGTIVQSESGDESYIGCFRGVYNESYVYYNGDEVTYSVNGLTSTYRYINDTPTKGIPPTDTKYWKVIAQGGIGQSSFKSTVFKRQDTKPNAPAGGSYSSPTPPTSQGWSDGIPSGDNLLWASTRIFSSDGKSPQQGEWTEPQQMTDTVDFDVEFSSVESPNPPSGHPNTNKQWSNSSDENTIWMATSNMRNGVWSDWEVSKIKGEKGADGISPNTAYKSTAFKRSNTKPTTPTGGLYTSPTPSGWSDGVPAGEEILWASTRIFSSDGKSPQQGEWTEPQQMTDTVDFDVEFSSVESPNPPSGHPNTNKQWSNSSDENTIWMATASKKNGEWGKWEISKIKGEKGEDGTSIKIKGTLTSTSQLPTPPSDPSDCYIIGQNLYVWNGSSWSNAGQFKGDKGDNGSNAYVHIKYAKSLTTNDWSDNNGETPDKYIGIYCDNTATDRLVWSLYTWTKWQGEDGFGYEYIYKLTATGLAPSTPTSTSQADGFVPTGWTDSPSGVSSELPYEWVCYRKQTNGVWGNFIGSASDTSKASLWAKYALTTNQNLIEGTGFQNEDTLRAWDVVSKVLPQPGVTIGSDYSGRILTDDRALQGMNAYIGATYYSKEYIRYKEILRQRIESKLKPSTWYTLSYWIRCLSDSLFYENKTSNLYGFCKYSLYLEEENTYTFSIKGFISQAAKSAGRTLRAYIYKLASNGVNWEWSINIDIDEITSVSRQDTFKAPSTGEYFISFYCFNSSGNNAPSNQTVTVERAYIRNDNRIAMTHVFPSIIDDKVNGFVDGVEQKLETDGAVVHGFQSWTRHTYTFKTPSELPTNNGKRIEQFVLFRLLYNAVTSRLTNEKGESDFSLTSHGVTYAEICMPKLEEGKQATPYCENSNDSHSPYYELRFAVNGSTKDAPELDSTSPEPSGWSTIQPEVTTAKYLWRTMSKKDYNGSLIENWSTPVRITPYDGKDGKDGKSPAPLYRGVYDSSKTYYGNEYRIDIVKYGDTWYVARVDAGTFKNIVPTDTSKWNPFGASFESIATGLLLAEYANIAGWIFRDNKLYSQNGSSYLDGVNGEVSIQGLIRRRFTKITDDNLSNYVKFRDYGNDIILPEIDYVKAGSLIEIDCNMEINGNAVLCYMPSIQTTSSDYFSDKANEARSYIGSSIIIYNNSNKSLAISGLLYPEGSTSFVSISVKSGEVCELKCNLLKKDNKETVAWMYNNMPFK